MKNRLLYILSGFFICFILYAVGLYDTPIYWVIQIAFISGAWTMHFNEQETYKIMKKNETNWEAVNTGSIA